MESEVKTNIFVVDDSRTLRSLLKRALEKMEFLVHEADCGEAAIELLNKVVPEAILLDVEMPGMGGFATCKKFRELPAAKHIPIMMVTSLEDVESVTRAYQVGATDFTTKPFNWDIIGHRVRYMVRTGRDYLALQKTQQELDQLNLDLEERIISRTNQLKRANQDLKDMLEQLQTTQKQLVESEKLASLGSLVAGIAHEINTPIGIAVSAASMLSKDIAQVEAAFSQNTLKKSDFAKYLVSVKEIYQLLEGNLQRAASLVRNFKLVSADQISENKRPIDMKTYLEDVIFSLKPALGPTKIAVSINCPEKLEVNTYPGVLSRAITIFVMNSIMHGFDPGQPGIVTISARPLNGDIELAYTDNGKGIAPENMKKVFVPFFTTRRGTGIGLGLNIVYNNVTKNLGGTITCESSPNQGVKFTIIFPKNS